MRRVIKFRVRDAETKKLLGWEWFNTCFNNGFMWISADDPEEICRSEHHKPPMLKGESPLGELLREEFIGLKDCKGKEVYEGDVLRETIEHDMGDENLYYVVKWFQPTCSFVAMSYADTVTDWEDSEEEYPTPLTPEDCKHFTVCGNEHQNLDWFTKD